jgi:hypothetical protein
MRLVSRWALGITLLTVLAVTASADSGKKFEVTDDCAPNADWGMNGCLRESGHVTRVEFNAANANRYPGHPAWRIDPPYVAEQFQPAIRAENTGGRGHTFTKVAIFGGGFVPPLNPPGAILAPECATVNAEGMIIPTPTALATSINPGQQLRVEGLAPGTYNFQCCIHPWMRTTVKIKAPDDRHH